MSLQIRSLTKKFGRNAAVSDVSIVVPKGKIVGFVGPNGAGKSTTMRAALSLIRPDSGTIVASGSDLTRNRGEYLSRVAGTIDAPARYPTLSAKQHLLYISRLSGQPEIAAVKALQLTGLEDTDKPAGRFSTGMKQRLALAMCLVGSPEYLILDEPTNGLDPIAVIEFREVLTTLAKDHGIGVLLSSHLLSEIERVCDSVVFIDGGKLIGTTTLKNSDQGEAVFLLRTDDDLRLRNVLSTLDFVVATASTREGIAVTLKGGTPQQLSRAVVGAGVGLIEMSRIADLEQQYLRRYGEAKDER